MDGQHQLTKIATYVLALLVGVVIALAVIFRADAEDTGVAETECYQRQVEAEDCEFITIEEATDE